MKIGIRLNICIFVLTVLLLAVVEWVGLQNRPVALIAPP